MGSNTSTDTPYEDLVILDDGERYKISTYRPQNPFPDNYLFGEKKKEYHTFVSKVNDTSRLNVAIYEDESRVKEGHDHYVAQVRLHAGNFGVYKHFLERE